MRQTKLNFKREGGKTATSVDAVEKIAPSKSWSGPPSWNQKPFSCIWCDLNFSSVELVGRHTRAIHEYNCNSCMKELVTWNDYLKHAKGCPHAKEDMAYYLYLKHL
jgi:hypothetical protein